VEPEELLRLRPLHREVDVLGDVAGLLSHALGIQLGDDDAHHAPTHVEQRPARVARLHRRRDLELALVVGEPCESRDLARRQRRPRGEQAGEREAIGHDALAAANVRIPPEGERRAGLALHLQQCQVTLRVGGEHPCGEVAAARAAQLHGAAAFHDVVVGHHPLRRHHEAGAGADLAPRRARLARLAGLRPGAPGRQRRRLRGRQGREAGLHGNDPLRARAARHHAGGKREDEQGEGAAHGAARVRAAGPHGQSRPGTGCGLTAAPPAGRTGGGRCRR
jgi:hypothetical protein